MKKGFIFVTSALLALGLASCNNPAPESSQPTASSVKSTAKSTSSAAETSQGPKKELTNVSISLGKDGGKAYITVKGTQSNYTAEEFKWAWGLLNEGTSTFDYGKERPADTDYTALTFDANNEFTVRLCLTDITTIKAGATYRIYGGAPGNYKDIGFESNMFGANDGTRNYYLRQDLNNSLTFDNIQPFTFSEASVIEMAAADLPTGVTEAGAYLKFGGNNTNSVTMDTINAWHTAGNIAGNFQRVIPENSYSVHDHADTERFWKVEGTKVYFYLYVGFIGEGEGWMLHFDLVSGNSNAGCGTSTKYNGETAYQIGGATFKIYSDSSLSGEENYWGCLGVYREGTPTT